MGKITRRVSFADRVHYSDDASATTVSTDDGLFCEDDDVSMLSCSIASTGGDVIDVDAVANGQSEEVDAESVATEQSEVSEGVNDAESVATEQSEVSEEEGEEVDTESVATEQSQEWERRRGEVDAESVATEQSEATEGEEEVDTESMATEQFEDESAAVEADSVNPEESEEDEEDEPKVYNRVEKGKESKVKHFWEVKDEPPLVFRDRGVWKRPDEYLGGGPEMSCSEPHKVRLRKSWVANEEEHADYLEFEAWKASRAKAAATTKKKRVKARSSPKKVENHNAEAVPPLAMSSNSEESESEEEAALAVIANKPGKRKETKKVASKPAKAAAVKHTKQSTKVAESESEEEADLAVITSPAKQKATKQILAKPTKAAAVKQAKQSRVIETPSETRKSVLKKTKDTVLATAEKPKSALKKGIGAGAKEMKTASTIATGKPKAALKTKGAPCEDKDATEKPKATLKKRNSTAEGNAKRRSKVESKTKQPERKDPELEADEKENLRLKEHIEALERKLHVTEVRTISQLADLEEETTKTMREYRAKADQAVRVRRAKNEKQALQQKVMKSQDVIEQLRRSNHKMRADGIKMQSAIEKLRASNQQLGEKNSFQRGYASEFLNFQKVEVKLAEDMNRSLERDIPKYEKLVRSMEEGLIDRVKSGNVERNAKDLYDDTIDSIFALLEESCTDTVLVDKVASLMDDDSDEETVMDNSNLGGSMRSLGGSMRSSSERRSSTKSAASASSGATKKSSPIIKKANKEVARPSPTKATPIRRHSSLRSSIAPAPKAPKAPQTKRPSSRDSFRSTRTPRKSKPVVSDDDDSTTCSITSVTSATSNFTVSEYL